jgi:type II secretory pathway pseudopilin PulG
MSLVELLIAALILGAVLVALFRAISSGFQGTERLIEESYAANHGISLLEALSCVGYSDLPEIPSGTTDGKVKEMMAAVPGFSFPGDPDTEYERTVEVIEVSRRTTDPADPTNSPQGALKKIQVNVTWECQYLRTRARRTITFQTLVTDDAEVTR